MRSSVSPRALEAQKDLKPSKLSSYFTPTLTWVRHSLHF
jgi:hypothetical protein